MTAKLPLQSRREMSDALTQQHSIPIALTAEQLRLHKALAGKDTKLADMYHGAIYAVTCGSNPERLSQAAQSIRELLQKLWIEYDSSLKQKDKGLKEKTKDLEGNWMKIRRKGSVLIHATQIPGVELEKFCGQLDEFFAWNNNYLPARREQTSRTITRMDPMVGRLPAEIMDLRVKELHALREYFEAVAHHNKYPKDDAEFRSYLEALEGFLLARLRPQTGQNFLEIERLIREGDANA